MLIAVLIQVFLVITGIAPIPQAYQVVLTLLAAVGLSVAITGQLRIAPSGDTGESAAHGLGTLVPGRDELERLTRRLRRPSTDESLDDRWARHVSDVTERWRDDPGDVADAGDRADRADPPTARLRTGRGGIMTAAGPRTLDAPHTGVGPPVDAPPAQPAPPGPSLRRILLVSAASVALAVLLWLPAGVVGVAGQLAVTVSTFLFGYAGYAAPLLPVLALGLLPAAHHEPVPWRLLVARRRSFRKKLRQVGWPALRAARERVLTRTAGIVLAVLGALHLLRDGPGFSELAFRRAGGIVGAVVGAPLGWLGGASGGIALLGTLLVCAAVAATAYPRPTRGPKFATSALALLLAVPLLGLTIGRLTGYDYLLGARGDRVVVLAGVSRDARHEIDDTGVSTKDIPAIARQLLATGIPVAGSSDGRRLAAELARPATAPTFPGSGGDLTPGACFTTVGPQAELRYPAPCGAAHTGEVYFIGRLPLTADPGTQMADAIGRAMCEKAYGDYLGVPYGGSFLPVEAPLRAAAWTPRPVAACWLRSVGPMSLRGSRLVASLVQGTGWDAGPGCHATAAERLTLVVDGKGGRCVTPGPSHPESVSGGTLTMDATLAVTDNFPADARVGIGCVDGADATTGYYIDILANGTMELWKHTSAGHQGLLAVKPKRTTSLKPNTPFDMHLTCLVRADGSGVEINAVTASTTLAYADRTQPIQRISPRLFVEAGAVAPITLTVSAFAATFG